MRAWGMLYKEAARMEMQAEHRILGPTASDALHWSERRRSPGGAFYTPHHLVHFLVRHTLQPGLLDIYRQAYNAFTRGQAPEVHTCIDRAKQLRVVDPACGCGRFLLAAFRPLRCLHVRLALYAERLAGRDAVIDCIIDQANRQALSSLQGVDIDEQAVAAARKVLLHAAGQEDDSLLHLQVGDATCQEAALVAEAEVYLGNPPWGAVGARRAASSLGLPMSNANTFAVFLARCLSGLTPGGRLGMVLPRNFCKGNDYEYLRIGPRRRPCRIPGRVPM
jgi:type I restriction-modification system DNA methylase subunit